VTGAERAWVPDVAAALALVPALLAGIATTGDLDWPPRTDFYREMGSTHAVMADRADEDPAYLGEGRWYNPLVPRVMAVLSEATGIDLPRLFTRAGPYLNLITPAGFYVLARVLLGGWRALACLLVFVYMLNPRLPGSIALYSPWLWTRNFSQGFCYLTAALLVLGFRDERLRWELPAGLLLGATFLLHTAPAVILVCFILLLCLREWLREQPRIPPHIVATKLAALGTLSLLVSLPFIYDLYARYGFRIRHTAPSRHIGIYHREMAVGLLAMRPLLGALGGYALLLRHRALKVSSRDRDACLIFLTAVFLPLAYGVVAQRLGYLGIEIPQLVPAFHFHIYFTAVQALFAGLGLHLLTQWLSKSMASLVPRIRIPAEPRLFVVVTLALVLFRLDTYATGDDLTTFRAESRALSEAGRYPDLYEWVLANTRMDDVFLVDTWTGLAAVASAARKVVVMDINYSNPFVDFEPRQADQAEMFTALQEGRLSDFRELAEGYSVDYVVHTDMDCCRLPRLTEPDFEHVYSRYGIGVYRVGRSP
jgi:hypothetical protein